MSYEVEMKFPLREPERVCAALARLGGAFGPPERQTDVYLAHPARDFRQTDEALRLRQIGPANFVTYKGPKLAGPTKTRREIELPLAEGAASAAAWLELWESLGFRRVAAVVKTRQNAHFTWQGRDFAATLDDVERVGAYLEVETLAAADALPAAQAAVQALAAELQLGPPERRSYLALLLGADEPAG